MNLPDDCPYGAPFTVDHYLSWSTGGYSTIQHNEVLDIFHYMLTDVCYDVQRERLLQPLNCEKFTRKICTTDDEAPLDIVVNRFSGGRFKRTYYDVRIFNSITTSYSRNKIASCYRNQEQGKKRKYEEWVVAVELASFMPIILSCTGGCRKITTAFLKRLASLLSHNKTHHTAKHSTGFSATLTLPFYKHASCLSEDLE